MAIVASRMESVMVLCQGRTARGSRHVAEESLVGRNRTEPLTCRASALSPSVNGCGNRPGTAARLYHGRRGWERSLSKAAVVPLNLPGASAQAAAAVTIAMSHT